MQNVRQLVAKWESSALLKNEVDYLIEGNRQLLLQEAGIVSPIGASQALAIKAGLAIPWTKLRCLRRWCIHVCSWITRRLLVHRVGFRGTPCMAMCGKIFCLLHMYVFIMHDFSSKSRVHSWGRGPPGSLLEIIRMDPSHELTPAAWIQHWTYMCCTLELHQFLGGWRPPEFPLHVKRKWEILPGAH